MTFDIVVQILMAYSDFVFNAVNYAMETPVSFPLTAIFLAVFFIGFVLLLSLIVFIAIVLPVYIAYKVVKKLTRLTSATYNFIAYGERNYR